MVNLKMILLILALICFILATVGVPARGANLVALGLTLTTLALLVP